MLLGNPAWLLSCKAASPAWYFGPSPHSLLNDQLHMHSEHCSVFALLSSHT